MCTRSWRQYHCPRCSQPWGTPRVAGVARCEEVEKSSLKVLGRKRKREDGSCKTGVVDDPVVYPYTSVGLCEPCERAESDARLRELQRERMERDERVRQRERERQEQRWREAREEREREARGGY